MSLVGAYTRQTVPEALLALIIMGGVIRLEVLNAGVMAGTGLTPEQAAEQGLMKNHWRWQVVVRDERGRHLGITFGFDPDDSPSVKSDVAQYAGSSRAGSSFGSDLDRFSFYGSEAGSEGDYGKPAQFSPVGSKGKPPAFKPPALKPVVTEDKSGAKIVSAPASIPSSSGHVIRQPVEGKPKLGVFNIKVVDRESTSSSAFVVFELPIIRNNLTFGHLISALDARGMEPFFFRMSDFAMFGCRDFIFNSAAEFIAKGFTTGFVKKEAKHIFELLGRRYTRARDNTAGTFPLQSYPNIRYAENAVDRAVWPHGFVAYVDPNNRVQFNQVA